MNKGMHRLVFNKARGELMAVAEFVTGHQNGGTPRPSAPRQNHVVAGLRPLAFSLLCAMNLVWISQAHAQSHIIADPGAPRNQQAQVLPAGNNQNIPVINIQTPNGKGVSRNTFSRFDVGPDGAVLNNARTHQDSQSQLAGYVGANPSLAGGNARIILNEVNARDPSQLRGYVDVAGQKAQVIVANPAGITCDGCGFINANRATLTTGTPQLDGSGNLTGYQVDNGKIIVNGRGMDASRTDQTDVLARAAEVNAGLWANELTVTTGTNRINASHPEQAEPRAASSDKPQFALDVSSLGGMYAGKITMTGTENGVGVRNAGYMGASVDEVTITASGRLENSGTLNAAGNARITVGGEMNNTGVIHSQDSVNARSSRLTNSGTLAAAHDVTLHTDGTVTNRDSAVVNAGSQLTVDADSLTNSGTLAAMNSITVQTRGAVTNRNSGVVNAGGPLSISADSLDNRGTVAAKNDITVTAQQRVNNTGRINGGKRVTVKAQQLDNAGTLYSTGSGNYNIDAFSSSGTFASGGDLNITGITQRHSGLTVAGLQANGNLGNTGFLDLNASQSITANGQLYAASDMRLLSPDLQLRGGTFSAGANATLATAQLDTRSALLSSGGSLSVSAASIDNRAGQWQSEGNISVTAGQLDNRDGKIRAGKDYRLTSSGSLDNRSGLISGNGALSVNDAAVSKTLLIENAAGTLIAGQQLDVNARTFSGSGQLLSLGGLRLQIDTDLDFNGELTANGDATLLTDGNLTHSGQIQAGQHLILSAANLDNRASGKITAGHTDITTATLTNRGLIDGSLTQINVTRFDNSGTGKIYGDNLLINAGTLNNLEEGNNAAVIAARDTLLIGAGQINNRWHSLIYSGGDMGIGGHIDENGQLSGRASLLENASATIESAGNMRLDVDNLNNRNLDFATHVVEIERRDIEEYSFYPDRDGGPIYSADEAWVANDASDHLKMLHTQGTGDDHFYQYNYERVTTEDQILKSDPGQILAGGSMLINASRLYNDRSEIIAGGTLVGNILDLVNTELKGERIQTDSGILHEFYRKKRKGSDSQGHRTDDYLPAPIVTEINLQPTTWLGNTAPTGSGLSTGQNVITYVNASTSVDVNGPGTLRISTATPGMPDNGLIQQAIDPATGYWLETDPRFASYRKWLSSDYMLDLMATDPNSLHKRLGDGFIEQRMIREQVVKLTGQRFLDGYASDEEQYRALIDSGVAFARLYHLVPGVALTAEQMAQLTSNIVWLVEQQVTLPDGNTVTALVPQVYIVDDGGRQAPSSALIAGRNVDLTISGKLTSRGTLSAAEGLFVDAGTISNLGGSMLAGDLWLNASGDINHSGGLLAGNNGVTMVAGGNINVVSQTVRTEGTQGYAENVSRVAEVRVGNGAGGELTMIAGGDMTLTAAAISNQAEGGSTRLAAENITLNTVTGSSEQNNRFNKDNWLNRSGSTETGAVISAQGDITLDAANNIHARAASLTSDKGDIAARAGNDITIESGRRTDHTDAAHKSSGNSGGGNRVSLRLQDTVDEASAIATTLSAENVTLSAGRDITITGSNAVATRDVSLTAGRDVTVQAAHEEYSSRHFREEKKSGAFTSGATVTFGSQSQSYDNTASGTESYASTIGSLEGNIAIDAGGSYRQTGSHVKAPGGDIGITAGDITIASSADAWQQKSIHTFKQDGLTLGVSNPIISAIQTAQDMHKASQRSGDARMQALAGATTGLAAYNAYNATGNGNAAQQAGGINISITYGQNRSEDVTKTRGVNQTGSQVQAGGNVILNASTREGRDGSGTIRVTGSDIDAGKTLGLIAENDILLSAADNTNSLRRDSESHSWGAGVGIAIGKGVSAGFTANGSLGRGEAEGDDLWRTLTHLNAGDTLFLQSGGDTTLSGATARGHSIIADVGRNLTIESLQDTSTYRSDDWNAGGSVTVGYGFSASASYGQNRVDADFASVTEQSGLFAGDGGFNVYVGEHTELVGAAIASSDKAAQDGNNQFSTGTLATSDIKNRSSYDASGFSIGGGFSYGGGGMIPLGEGDSGGATGGGVGKDQKGNATTGANADPSTTQPGWNGVSATTPVYMSASDDTRSKTRAGISGADITIRDEEGQKARTGQTAADAIAGLNRDVSSDRDGTSAVDNIYARDKDKIDAGFEITRAFQNEVGNFVVAKAREADAMKKSLIEQGIDPDTSADYLEALKWAPGGAYSQVITAITAATGGNIMDGLDGLAQAAVLNYVQGMGAQKIKKLADRIGEGTPEGEAARAVLQGLAACGAQAGQGGDCVSAGLGTAAGVIANSVLDSLDKKPEDMTENEKQARSDIVSTLVGVLTEATGGQAVDAVNAIRVEMWFNEFVKGTTQRIKDVATPVADLLRKPKGQVTREEIYAELSRLEKLAYQGDLTNTESLHLSSLYLSVATRAASENLMTPEEIMNSKLFVKTAINSMAFSGGGVSKMPSGGARIPTVVTGKAGFPKTMTELHYDLQSKGFMYKSTSAAGYTTYKHSDGRAVTIKPSGEVIPTKPKVADNGKKYNERTDYHFNRLEDQNHSTGHFISKDK